MKKWHILITLVFIILNCICGFSESIKLPDEIVTGKTLRIEKSNIFTRPAPAFEVVFPDMTIPDEKLYDGKFTLWSREGPEGKTAGRSYLSLSAGTYDTIRGSFFHTNRNSQDIEHSLLLDSSYASGHRKNGEKQENSLAFMWNSPASGRFSLETERNRIGLPGRDFNPTDDERDSFSFRTKYSYGGKKGFVPSFSQSFYNVDNVDANFLLLNLQVDRTPFALETALERLDVFGEFSTMSFYQGAVIEKKQLTLGGGLKVVEDYGVRFLPAVRYSAGDNFRIRLEGAYQIPDFYREVMHTEYKELINHDLAPEEQYKLNIEFGREFKNTVFNMDVSQAYRENFYAWADTDGNGLFEPSGVQCWQTSAGIALKQRLSPQINLFFNGEKNFLSEKTDFYPEETFDAGITLFSSFASWKFWMSYTGERFFTGTRTGSDTILNAEIKVLFGESAEWGMGAYNLADKDYLTVPGYPAEGRKFVSYLKLYF